LALVPLIACPQSIEEPPPAPGEEQPWSATALFDGAAEQWGVPAELLAAIAWHESSFAPGDAEHTESRPAVGWMGLSPARVAEAVALSGIDEERIADRTPNIYAGAAVLDALRDELAPDAPDATVNVEWWPVVVAWADQDEEWLAHDFAADVFRTLQLGLDAGTADGETVSIRARRFQDLEDVPFEFAPWEAGEERFGPGYPQADRKLLAHGSNYDARPGGTGGIERVVLHTTEGSYAGAVSWFRNGSSDVSAHYVVRKSDGEITRMVDDDDRAWHACRNNSDTIGIEHEGAASNSSTWTPAMLDSSARLTAWLVDEYSIPIDRQHIVGHGEIQPSSCSGRTDPGVYFPWDDYMAAVTTYATGVPPVTPTIAFTAPTDGASVTDPVHFEFTHVGIDHVELWSGPALLAPRLAGDPASFTYRFDAVGSRTIRARGYAAGGSLLAFEDVSFTIDETLPGDDDDATDDDDAVDDDDAAPPECAYDECVDSLPWVGVGNTTFAPSNWDSYSCAPNTDESGGEVVYQVDVPRSGVLTAAVQDGEGVDIDVHILASANNWNCLDRGHHEASTWVSAGTYWVAADTWVNSAGTPQDGTFTLTLSLD